MPTCTLLLSQSVATRKAIFVVCSVVHCHSLSLASVKSRLVLPFWYWLTRVVLENGPLNGCVCVVLYKDNRFLQDLYHILMKAS